MIKFFLCIFIMLSGIGAGQLKAKTFENRVTHLQDLITTLKILESEMRFRLDPLPVIFMRISKMKDGNAGCLFEKTCQLINEGYSHDFSNCWNHAVHTIYKDTSLSNADIQIVCELGIELGKTDIIGQYSLFSRTYSLLGNQVTEAIEEKKTKGRMYKSLGAAVGILVVIILV